MLGGEIIRDLHEDPSLRKVATEHAGHMPKRFRVRADQQAVATTPQSSMHDSDALTQLARAGGIGTYVGTC